MLEAVNLEMDAENRFDCTFTNMGVACFFGLETFFEQNAPKILNSINRALERQKLPLWQELSVDTDVFYQRFAGLRCMGRSALDHNSARAVAAFADEAYGLLFEHGTQFDPLRLEGGTPVFIPLALTETVMMDELWLGSSVTLHRQLTHYASYLGIPLENGQLEDDMARRINDFEFGEDDAVTWLMLFEASRLSVQHDVALVIG
jgi:hypothetical protein